MLKPITDGEQPQWWACNSPRCQ